jgi:hypothetical protein
MLARDTTVQQSSILLYMDGVQIPSGSVTISNYVYKPGNTNGTGSSAPYPTAFDGATVTYLIPTLLAPGSLHTNTVVFKDYPDNTWFTNTWSWTAHTAPTLLAANSLPIGVLSQRGFKARMVATTDTWGNSVANAFMVLDYPATNASAVALASTNIVPLVAWDIVNPPTHNGAVTNYPGQCLPAGHPNYYAVQVQAYLQLTAGGHRLHVDSDDAVAVYSGTDPNDTSTALVYNDGVTHTDFDFFAPADGLYPFNIIYEEGVGDAYLCLYSVDLLSGVQSLVNTNGGAVAAFYPPPIWNCMSSTSVSGLTNYNNSVANTMITNKAVITTSAGVNCSASSGFNQTVTGWSGTNTITLPAPSSATYYRLYGPGSSKILGYKMSGTNLVITYRCQSP